MSNKIDDTKPCTCNPPLSGSKGSCKRCHPSAAQLAKSQAKVAQAKLGHDPIKPAQVKRQRAVRVGLLAELFAAQAEAKDPYADYEEGS